MQMSQPSYIKLEFLYNGERAATIEIASESKNIAVESYYKSPVIENKDRCQNVKIVRKREELDGSSPIVLNVNAIAELPLLLLLEETDYEIKVEFEDKFKKSITPEDLKAATLKILREEGGQETISIKSLLLEQQNGIYHGSLRFNSYVGKSFFDISIGGWSKIPFEVRSKKIDYLEHYPIIISDISEVASSALIHSNSPLYSEYTLAEKRNETFYEDFMLLKYIMKEENLPSSFEAIKRNISNRLNVVEYREDVFLARMIDNDVILDVVSSPSLVRSESGVLFGKYHIKDVLQKGTVETIDIPENRFVKDFLKTIDIMIHSLIKETESNKKVNDYIRTELKEMEHMIRDYLSERWISEIGDLTVVPRNSMILQKKLGYRDIFRMYHMLEMSISVSIKEIEELLKGNNRKLHAIYEFWCYIKLFNTLRDMSVNKPSFKMKTDDKKWILSLKETKEPLFKIPLQNVEVNVVLFFDKKYRQRNSDYTSYSLDFDPDFSLKIWIEDDKRKFTIVHFDSKYKVDTETTDEEHQNPIKEYKEADIHKMHTYRDAILRTSGAFILYPGTETETFSKREDAYFPLIGAQCLKPGDKKDLNALHDLLKNIFSSFVLCKEERGELVFSK